MFPALNMELEIVRTVLKNPVNDIYVCTDLRKNTGIFYTMVSIADPDCRRKVTEKLNTERLFFSNRDFIGSFIYENSGSRESKNSGTTRRWHRKYLTFWS